MHFKLTNSKLYRLYYCILYVHGKLLSMKEAQESLQVFIMYKLRQTAQCPSTKNEALLKAKTPHVCCQQ